MDDFFKGEESKVRILAIVQYDGTNFIGWQIQPEGRSVQEEIEKVISQILNTPTKIYGSGRTDAGVHAFAQTFHFDVNKDEVDLGRLRYSINSLLPLDIHVISLEVVEDNFHARFDVVSKTYLYSLSLGEYDVFTRRYSTQLPRNLDVEKMKSAAKLFIGEHDFKNFTSKEEDKKNFVRTIHEFTIDLVENTVIFRISGTGFMKYMVRMIVGTLIEVGLNKINEDDIAALLDSKIRSISPYKAPAEGLFLMNVEYQRGEKA